MDARSPQVFTVKLDLLLPRGKVAEQRLGLRREPPP